MSNIPASGVTTQPAPATVREMGSRPASQTLAGILVILAFAILYLLTLDDGLRSGELAGGDLITHQYAQVQARPSNAPGYPLYTMGGWLWFRVGRLILSPGHNPISILSSYSTLWALIALGLLYLLMLEATGRGHRGNWPVAALATAFYGMTYFFWYYAVTTEQYTSAVAWTLGITLLAFCWDRTRADRYLLWMALLVGVGLAHMVTVLFIVPPLLWFVLRGEPKLLRRSRLIAAAAVLVLLPLLSYIYVYVQGARHPEWRGAGEWTSTGQWFWRFISTRQGRDELTWSLQPFLTREYPSLVWGELTWLGLIVGLAGWLAVGRRWAITLYATAAIYAIFCWIDRLGNWYQVIMPLYALLAVGIAVAADWVWRRLGTADGRLSAVNRRPRATAVRGIILVVLAGLVIYRGALSYPRADSSHRAEDIGLAPGWAILADDPPAGAAVLGILGETLALNYITQIWGERPDVRAVTSDQARALLAGDGPLAVTAAALPLVPAEVSSDAHLSALGRTLIAVTREPSSVMPVGLAHWQHRFGDGISLAGGRLAQNQATGETIVLLVWQAETQPARDWSVSVRLTRDEAKVEAEAEAEVKAEGEGEGGVEIAQVDYVHPVFGAYPTTRWSAGEVVLDAYPFDLPHRAPDGAMPTRAPDGVTVILYRATADGAADSGFENLDVARFSLR